MRWNCHASCTKLGNPETKKLKFSPRDCRLVNIVSRLQLCCTRSMNSNGNSDLGFCLKNILLFPLEIVRKRCDLDWFSCLAAALDRFLHSRFKNIMSRKGLNLYPLFHKHSLIVHKTWATLADLVHFYWAKKKKMNIFTVNLDFLTVLH